MGRFAARWPRLTQNQERLMGELAEPSGNPDGEWFFNSLRDQRSLGVLVRHGLAARGAGAYDSPGFFKLTEEGREWLRTGHYAQNEEGGE